jgi:hypothetical protein
MAKIVKDSEGLKDSEIVIFIPRMREKDPQWRQ